MRGEEFASNVHAHRTTFDWSMPEAIKTLPTTTSTSAEDEIAFVDFHFMSEQRSVRRICGYRRHIRPYVACFRVHFIDKLLPLFCTACSCGSVNVSAAFRRSFSLSLLLIDYKWTFVFAARSVNGKSDDANLNSRSDVEARRRIFFRFAPTFDCKSLEFRVSALFVGVVTFAWKTRKQRQKHKQTSCKHRNMGHLLTLKCRNKRKNAFRWMQKRLFVDAKSFRPGKHKCCLTRIKIMQFLHRINQLIRVLFSSSLARRHFTNKVGDGKTF